jgi:hypothetical protein
MTTTQILGSVTPSPLSRQIPVARKLSDFIRSADRMGSVDLLRVRHVASGCARC